MYLLSIKYSVREVQNTSAALSISIPLIRMLSILIVHGSSILSYVLQKLWRSGLYCRSGLRNFYAIVTTVNQSSIKEQVTNFSEQPFKPTGIEFDTKETHFWWSTPLKPQVHLTFKTQRPQLFGI